MRRVKPSLKSAFVGFSISAITTFAALGCLYVFGTAYVIETQSDTWTRVGDYSVLEAEAAIREDALWVARGGAEALIFLFAVYWLLAGLSGLEHGLRASLANALLVVGAACLASLSANRFFYWIEGYCDQLPFPHEGFQLLKIHECPSSATFMGMLSIFSIALFVVSLVLRVAHSRKV